MLQSEFPRLSITMDIRVSAAAKDRDTRSHVEEIENLVTPGDIITSDSGFMRYAPEISSI